MQHASCPVDSVHYPETVPGLHETQEEVEWQQQKPQCVQQPAEKGGKSTPDVHAILHYYLVDSALPTSGLEVAANDDVRHDVLLHVPRSREMHLGRKEGRHDGAADLVSDYRGTPNPALLGQQLDPEDPCQEEELGVVRAVGHQDWNKFPCKSRQKRPWEWLPSMKMPWHCADLR